MHNSFPTDQLLNGSLSSEASQTLLIPLGFRDWQTAIRHLQRIAGQSEEIRHAMTELLPYLLMTLSNCADPDQALVNFERFTCHENANSIFEKLIKNPRTIEILVTIFAGSQFLTEILLRNPLRLDMLTNRTQLAHQKSIDEFQQEALSAMQALPAHERTNALRRYQKGELLRIGASDLLSLYDLPAVTSQLSNLADGMARACLIYASNQTGINPKGFVVLGMGKLGGGELNYSSDIDLLFLCDENDTNYLRLGQLLIDALATMSAEGFLYRVDMRLRPWGRDGALVPTIPGYLNYLNKHARLWEKQALLKARPIAGDLELGESFLKQIESFIFGENPETLRASVHAMKQRTEEILRSKGREWGQVKLGEGSIRDVEFVVQYMQLANGKTNIKLRKKSTLQALRRLVKFGHITTHEARILTDGYIFQRTVEHFLQLMHYRQTYSLPSDPAAIHLLARRLGFPTQEAFLERYQQHSQAIRSVYSKYIGGISSTPVPGPEIPAEEPDFIKQHLARMDASYATAFSPEEIGLHASLANKLDAKNLVYVQAEPFGEKKWRVTVVAYDYLGELSLICGLMFLYGLDIQSGEIFTYENPEKPSYSPTQATKNIRRRSKLNAISTVAGTPSRPKIVDVFTVRTLGTEPDWNEYTQDLQSLLQMLHTGQRREARSLLAKRVGAVFEEMERAARPLFPIEIDFDNDSSQRYTVLHIKTADTVGFLYEFTNALSLTHTYISRMVVQTSRESVDDMLYVTDENGSKITNPEKLRELRTAAVLIKHFTHLLPRSPNPASALLHFREFLAQLFKRPNWANELNSLENPQVMDNLARLLGVSDFLWDDFMRMQYANLFPVVSSTLALSTAKSRADLQAELTAALALVHKTPDLPRDDDLLRTTLNQFKDREMFRIDMRHILGLTEEFWDFSQELTDLTEVIVNAAYHITAEDLRFIHGTPRLPDGSISQMAIMALGKCGGRELGFASDIELMCIYSGEGRTDGAEPIEASVFFEKVVKHLLGTIQARQEGIFQIDLQLRPYGKAGSMGVSLDSFRHYYAPHGPAWAYERQALVKMRPIAGDEALGEQVCALRDEFIYNGTPFDVTSMRAMRERQVRHLVTAGKFNAKYSPGGLVDIEYLVQGLQINHGVTNEALRQTNIRNAMAELHQCGIISDEDYTRLHKAHTFLRWLIDSMRVVRGNSKDVTVPVFGSEEFAFLARRLKYGNDVQKLQDDLLEMQANVVEMNRRLLP